MNDFDPLRILAKITQGLWDEKNIANILKEENILNPVAVARLVYKGTNPGEEKLLDPINWPKLLETLNDEFGEIYQNNTGVVLPTYREVKISLTHKSIELILKPITYKIKVKPEKFLFNEAGFCLGVPIVPDSVVSVTVSYELIPIPPSEA